MGEDMFSRLTELYRESVFRLAYCYTKSYADAEDITQDVFLKLYTGNAEFSDDAQAKAWLLKVTANRSKDLLRTYWYRFSQPLGDCEQPAPEDGSNRVLDAIMKLSPSVRSAVYLHYVEGYTAKETAVVLRCSETAVTSRLWRGRKQLLRLLADEENAEGGASL